MRMMGRDVALSLVIESAVWRERRARSKQSFSGNAPQNASFGPLGQEPPALRQPSQEHGAYMRANFLIPQFPTETATVPKAQQRCLQGWCEGVRVSQTPFNDHKTAPKAY